MPNRDGFLQRAKQRWLHPVVYRYRDLVPCRPARTDRQRTQLLASPGLEAGERALLSQIDTRIDGGDAMYKGNGVHYFRVGLSAIQCIDRAMVAADVTAVESVLDLPCGNGRVCRFLRKRFPEARITACDIDRLGVDFCVRNFGVAGVYSTMDLDNLHLDESFDLIWCGSLLTHIESSAIVSLLRTFKRYLAPGGLLVFTAHGDTIIQNLASIGPAFYGLVEESSRVLASSYAKTGYGYAEYARPRPGYGFCVTSRRWMHERIREIGGWTDAYHAERGWDDHHDVVGVRKDR